MQVLWQFHPRLQHLLRPVQHQVCGLHRQRQVHHGQQTAVDVQAVQPPGHQNGNQAVQQLPTVSLSHRLAMRVIPEMNDVLSIQMVASVLFNHQIPEYITKMIDDVHEQINEINASF